MFAKRVVCFPILIPSVAVSTFSVVNPRLPLADAVSRARLLSPARRLSPTVSSLSLAYLIAARSHRKSGVRATRSRNAMPYFPSRLPFGLSYGPAEPFETRQVDTCIASIAHKCRAFCKAPSCARLPHPSLTLPWPSLRRNRDLLVPSTGHLSLARARARRGNKINAPLIRLVDAISIRNGNFRPHASYRSSSSSPKDYSGGK